MSRSNENIFSNTDTDLVIFPSTGIELKVFEMLIFARMAGKKTLIALENWDNLTSKSVFLFKPDFLTVMGSKMALQANQMYSFNIENIGVTGLPRFEKIIERSVKENYQNEESTVTTPFKILYLGYSLPYDEVGTVNSIAKCLNEKGVISNYKLTYRPHPFRQQRFSESKLVANRDFNVFVDHSHLDENRADTKKLPLIQDSYIDNLLNYDLIITTPTTMALEAMLLKIPTIIDGIDDKVHITTPSKALKFYTHLEDLADISNANVANTPEDIVHNIIRLWNSPSKQIYYDLKELVQTKSTFSEALIDFLVTIKRQSK